MIQNGTFPPKENRYTNRFGAREKTVFLIAGRPFFDSP
jgi:hypothetical protein